MPRSTRVITITIPRELDELINRLVQESKNTPQPISKSGFIATACYELLRVDMEILASQKKPEKGGKA